MKKDFRIAKITFMVCVLFLIIFTALLMDFLPRDDPIDDGPAFVITFTSISMDGDFELEINSIDDNFTTFEDLIWQLVDKNNIEVASNEFPIITGAKGSTNDSNIMVAWFDNDNNSNLSVNDTITIHGDLVGLKAYKFEIINPLVNENKIVFEVVVE